jgi:hypothetical protein
MALKNARISASWCSRNSRWVTGDVGQDHVLADDDIGRGVAVGQVLGSGQVERGREQPGVFPQVSSG